MIIINNKHELKTNEYEVKGDTAYIKLRKKDDKIIDTKVDTDDLKMVLDKGLWFPEWNKDFNSYLVQSLVYSADGKKSKEKQSLHSFILGVHPKTPIKHINGDTLDNRKCNIEVYNQNVVVNDYEDVDAETIAIILRDKHGIKKEKTLIDKKDLDKVINSGYSWVYYVSRGKHHAVANSPEGRIYLEKFLMNPSEDMITVHINHNTLDNRKSNLNNVLIVEEPEDLQDSNLDINK